MLSFMKHHGGTFLPWLVVAVGLLTLGASETFAATAEFYSWVTPSGEMVLTDNSGNIPPARVRGPVSVHRYQEVPPQSTNRSLSPSANPSLNAIPRGMEGTDVGRVDLLDLVMESEQGIAANEDWAPLAPYAGTYPMYGFWSNQSGNNPTVSVARYLDRLRMVSPASARLHRSGQAGLRRAAGNATQSAQSRNLLPHTHSVMGASYSTVGASRTSPHCCTIGNRSISGRRSAAGR